ncbi:MAG TPA: class I SAM-dependent rRNA methyltransferase [Acidobacteriota bacterium]|nr:class I SAM-dependent rRNA methyltransferase [Acidobacteriota bacterium]HQO25319.1 class I SAM-dependent rRNA methyltransferase [Acidobacteriota bacterium]HQP73754.1 class I SAM-dependent rRNA methyltransferase [Acidobacteriota bacterium]
MERVVVRDEAVKKIRNFYLWVFADEVRDQPAGLGPGEPVEVRSPRGEILGTGFYHPTARVTVRLFHHKRIEPDAAFWRRRLQQALALREPLRAHSNGLRLVYSEGDYLPGLVVDDFADHLVIQCRTTGMDRIRPLIVELLQKLRRPASIYERSDVPARQEEGLAFRTGQLAGVTPPRVRIAEHGVQFWVDIPGGQKTGFFSDQRDARRHFASLLRPGDRVLDAFCYTGGFGLYAARMGAAVTAVDKDEAALTLAAANAELNEVTARFETVAADLFTWLPETAAAGRVFDAISLDPPALIKYKNQQNKGRGLLMDLIRPCLRMLRPGGLLHVSSCAYHVGPELLREAARIAAGETGKRLLVAAETVQAADHPYFLQMPETQYLKGFTYRVLPD